MGKTWRWRENVKMKKKSSRTERRLKWEIKRRNRRCRRE
jgi:hypothetical protein